MNRVIRPDQIGVKFGKMRRLKTKPSKKATLPESFIQAQIDGTCATTPGLERLRIPDLVYRLCSPFDHRLREHEKRILAETFEGYPDNDLKLPLDRTPFYLGCMIETKTDVGKQSGGQRLRAKILPVTVVSSLDEFKAALEKFQKQWEKYTKESLEQMGSSNA